MYTLYLRPGACSLASHIVLRETGAPFAIEKVDLASKTLLTGGDYLKINPKGQVPALRLPDGDLLTEGAAICQYLADNYPKAALLPPVGDLLRYRVLEWFSFIGTEIHKTVSPLARPTTPPEARTELIAHAEKKFAIADRALEGRESLTDAGFSIADAYLFVIASWMPLLGIAPSTFPNLAIFANNVRQRPSIQAALLAEGLI